MPCWEPYDEGVRAAGLGRVELGCDVSATAASVDHEEF